MKDNEGKTKKKEEKKEKKEKKKEKKKREPFFTKLGKFTSKNYKAILIVWIILLAGAAYPALQLSKVISYNELEFLPDDLEYHQGSEIMNELFPTNSTGTTIIVIQSEELISSAANTEYIRNLTERIMDMKKIRSHSRVQGDFEFIKMLGIGGSDDLHLNMRMDLLVIRQHLLIDVLLIHLSPEG